MGARVCGVVDLQVSRLGVCVCLAPSLCWGPQGVVVPVQGNVGAVTRRGVCVSPWVCLCGVLCLPCLKGGGSVYVWCTCVCVLCESCQSVLFGGDSIGLCCLHVLVCGCCVLLE